MVKTHPWQRWPDKKTSGSKSNYDGQTNDPSWKESSIRDLESHPTSRSKYLYDVKLKGRGGIWLIRRVIAPSRTEAGKEAINDFEEEPERFKLGFGKPEIVEVTEIEKV